MKRPSKSKIAFARKLRKCMTKAEIKLWQTLRKRQLYGFKFRKQVPIGEYIADFICYETKVIVELDGGQHGEDDAIKYDKQRTNWLTEQGYEVLRFWNIDVLQNAEGVVDMILVLCRRRPPSYPSPARGEGTC